MRRLLTSLVLMMFVSTMLATATHLHPTKDAASLSSNCVQCHFSTSQGFETAEFEVATLDPPTFIPIPLPGYRRLPLSSVRALERSPNHSPPAFIA